MTLSFLESFDVKTTPEPPRMVPESELDAARQEGREAGYRDGWDAATAAAENEQSRLGAEVAASIMELGFTYQEARAHVMRGIEPLLHELLTAVLPSVMAQALGRTVLDELSTLAAAGADTPVLVSVSPDEAEALRAALPQDASLPLRLVEDSALDPGQAALRLGQAERMVDLSGLLSRLTDALGAVADLNERTLAHA